MRFSVDLDIFNGPLDLLLYLVRKHEVDVTDIPIARITDQYLEYLAVLEQIDVDAGSQRDAECPSELEPTSLTSPLPEVGSMELQTGARTHVGEAETGSESTGPYAVVEAGPAFPTVAALRPAGGVGT